MDYGHEYGSSFKYSIYIDRFVFHVYVQAKASLTMFKFLKIYTTTAFLLLIISIGFTSCKKEQKASTPIKVEFKKEGELRLFKQDTDSLIKQFNIEFAEDEYETQTGLMNRYSMQDHQGMLFIFPNSQPRSFYMKDTFISLDIIYIDEQMKIVSFQKNGKPMDETSLPSGVPAKYVLEIKAGLSDQLQLAIGDKIEYHKN